MAKSQLQIPTRMADVEGWCEQLRVRRLNDDGRAAIDMLELLLLNAMSAAESAKGPAGRVRVLAAAAPSIEKQFRVALAFDRAENDTELVRLRRQMEAKQGAEAALEAMH